MAMFDITGTVDTVLPLQTFGSGFKKRAVVINTKEYGEKRDNLVKLTAAKDKVSLLDGLRSGDEIKVRFFIDGHPWDGPKGRQYFVDLNIVQLKCTSEQASNCPPPAVPSGTTTISNAGDDMPF